MSNNVEKVWSVTINGKNDCVVMTEEEAAMIALKFSGEHFEMYNMTQRHGMEPEHLQKANRMDVFRDCPYVEWRGSAEPTVIKGKGTGTFGGAAKVDWTFKDLMEM